jgi:hypothetical protein
MTRSEFLGAQQCREQVNEKPDGDHAAQDQLEHGALLLPLAEEDVGDQGAKAGDAQGYKKDVRHHPPPLGNRAAGL